MGKKDSFLFTRMHDTKSAIQQQENGVVTLIASFIPGVFEQFAMTYPNFPAQDAILAISALISLDNSDTRKKYAPQMAKYENNISLAIAQVMNNSMPLIQIVDTEINNNQRTGLYVSAFCAQMRASNDPEMRDTACQFLNEVLKMEEKGVNVQDDVVIWMTLALFSDFETWHDNTFGNPIVGPSNYDAEHGNTQQSQQQTPSQPKKTSTPRRQSASREVPMESSNSTASTNYSQPISESSNTRLESTHVSANNTVPSAAATQSSSVKNTIITWASSHIIASIAIAVVVLGFILGPVGVILGLLVGGGLGIYLYTQKKSNANDTFPKAKGTGILGLNTNDFSLSLDFNNTIDFENEVLVRFFSICKASGLQLCAEPQFITRGDFVNANFDFTNGDRGSVATVHGNDISIDFYLTKSSSLSEDDVEKIFMTICKDFSQFGDFTYLAKRGKTGQTWTKFMDDARRPRRTYM